MTPNNITLLRIGATPFFLLFFMINTTWSLIVCLLLAALFEITDFLDGNMARTQNMISDFGKLMDPFADSISRFTVFLCFLSAGLAPVWIIAIFFYRDVFVSIVRVFSMKEGVVVAARKSGKLKAWVQAVAIFSVLIIMILEKMNIVSDTFFQMFDVKLETVLILIAAIVTLWSAFDYWLGSKAILIRAMNGESKK